MSFPQGVELKGTMHEYIEDKTSRFAECFEDEKWLQKLVYLNICLYIIQVYKSLQDLGENIFSSSVNFLKFTETECKNHATKQNLEIVLFLLGNPRWGKSSSLKLYLKPSGGSNQQNYSGFFFFFFCPSFKYKYMIRKTFFLQIISISESDFETWGRILWWIVKIVALKFLSSKCHYLDFKLM